MQGNRLPLSVSEDEESLKYSSTAPPNTAFELTGATDCTVGVGVRVAVCCLY